MHYKGCMCFKYSLKYSHYKYEEMPNIVYVRVRGHMSPNSFFLIYLFSNWRITISVFLIQQIGTDSFLHSSI